MYLVYSGWMPATRKPGKSKLVMVHLRLEETLLQRLKDFRWEHRFENRTKLIRYLLNWALDHHEKPKKSG